jgi:hypothetical protein
MRQNEGQIGNKVRYHEALQSTIDTDNIHHGQAVLIFRTDTLKGHRCHSRQGGRRHSPRKEERQAPPARIVRPDHQLRCLAVNSQVRLHHSAHTVLPGPALTLSRTFTGIVNSTTKRNYRPDLRQDAVARASAIRKSQRAVKADNKPTKTRGAKARAAASSE